MQVDSRKEIKTAVDLAFKKDGQVQLAGGMFSCHDEMLRGVIEALQYTGGHRAMPGRRCGGHLDGKTRLALCI